MHIKLACNSGLMFRTFLPLNLLSLSGIKLFARGLVKIDKIGGQKGSKLWLNCFSSSKGFTPILYALIICLPVVRFQFPGQNKIFLRQIKLLECQVRGPFPKKKIVLGKPQKQVIFSGQSTRKELFLRLPLTIRLKLFLLKL